MKNLFFLFFVCILLVFAFWITGQYGWAIVSAIVGPGLLYLFIRQSIHVVVFDRNGMYYWNGKLNKLIVPKELRGEGQFFVMKQPYSTKKGEALPYDCMMTDAFLVIENGRYL